MKCVLLGKELLNHPRRYDIWPDIRKSKMT